MGHSLPNDGEDGVNSADSVSNDGDSLCKAADRDFVLKKGPWTTAEDAILVDYVKRHGEGNWNAVQKHSSLSRCGKSCRLRWANHLRPNLKKGAFTSEEERIIVELHAKMGNKWARMAALLPGRTDNEIKNYWNTRIKRRQRAGLPLYPTELCLQALPENQRCLNSSQTFGGDDRCHEYMQINEYEGSDVMVDSLNMMAYKPEVPNTSTNGSIMSDFSASQFYGSSPYYSIGVQKHTQEQDEPMSDHSPGAVNDNYPFDIAQNDTHEKVVNQSYGPCFPYDSNQTKQLFHLGLNPDSHFMPNATFSASKPFPGAKKLELPSLQYHESGLGVWDFLPFDTAPESLDSFMQCPLSETLPAYCPSPQNSGLLEDLLCEAKSRSKSDNQSSGWATPSSISHGYITYSSALRPHFTGLKNYIGPTSPSGNSTESSVNRCSHTDPHGSSTGEKIRACPVKSEVVDQTWAFDVKRKETLSQYDCSRPDSLLGTYWLEQSDSSFMQHGCVTDSPATLFGDDFISEFNSMSEGADASITGPGLSYCTWNNMPSACQMSNLL